MFRQSWVGGAWLWSGVVGGGESLGSKERLSAMRPLGGPTGEIGPLCIVPRTWRVRDTESALHQHLEGWLDEGEGLVTLAPL